MSLIQLEVDESEIELEEQFESQEPVHCTPTTSKRSITISPTKYLNKKPKKNSETLSSVDAVLLKSIENLKEQSEKPDAAKLFGDQIADMLRRFPKKSFNDARITILNYLSDI